jgi:hypothetical protein
MSRRFLAPLSTLAAVVATALLVTAPALADEAPAPPAGAPALSCTTGAHSGTYDGEAETATQIVCDELRARGARGAFQVTIAKLGSATFLSVSDPTGETRRLQLSGIEEVPVAAPRLAESVLERTSVKSTQKVDNIVGDDQREYKKQKGEMLAGLGMAGTHVFGDGTLAMPAFNLRGAYELLDFAAVADLRYAGTTSSSATQDASLFSLGGGVRYFFLRSDLTPFLGGGMSYTAVNYDGDWSGSASGMGAYFEGGVEALRTHKSRLAFDLRVELPFYSVALTNGGGGHYDPETYNWVSGTTQKRTAYSVPVSFAIAYSYRGI